jgi:hypothetical protein
MMHCFFRGVLSIGNGVWLPGVSFCLYTGMPGWAGHSFGVVSVSESFSVIIVLDGGSKTIVGFVNGSSGCGFQSKCWVAWEKKREKKWLTTNLFGRGGVLVILQNWSG